MNKDLPANEAQFLETYEAGYFYQCTSFVTEDGILTQTIEFEPHWHG
tara:strand:+ start:427 stop:567 length:141 start_codon:yes stop_codon:yes gene_type:complete